MTSGKALDKQEGGSHYDLPIQPLEYISCQQARIYRRQHY